MSKKNLRVSNDAHAQTADIDIRTIAAINLCYLPPDFPFIVTAIAKKSEGAISKKIIECIEFAQKLFEHRDKDDTRRTYKAICMRLLEFLKANNLLNIHISEFGSRDAENCMDWLLIEKKLKNTSYNNYLSQLVLLFNLFKKKGFLKTNPFSGLDYKKKQKTDRRPFTESERQIITKAAFEKDYWLFIAILFQYCVVMRRTEVARLRFKDIDLQKGLIFIDADKTKNGKEGTITIPAAMLTFLRDKRFTRYPANFLIFGENMQPHATIACGKNTVGNHFRGLIKVLKEEGVLGDMQHATFYSFKISANTDFSKQLKLITLRDHNRHESVEQTLVYYRAEKWQEEVYNLNINLFG
jgi:integrase/recombinase XerD